MSRRWARLWSPTDCIRLFDMLAGVQPKQIPILRDLADQVEKGVDYIYTSSDAHMFNNFMQLLTRQNDAKILLAETYSFMEAHDIPVTAESYAAYIQYLDFHGQYSAAGDLYITMKMLGAPTSPAVLQTVVHAAGKAGNSSLLDSALATLKEMTAGQISPYTLGSLLSVYMHQNDEAAIRRTLTEVEQILYPQADTVDTTEGEAAQQSSSSNPTSSTADEFGAFNGIAFSEVEHSVIMRAYLVTKQYQQMDYLWEQTKRSGSAHARNEYFFSALLSRYCAEHKWENIVETLRFLESQTPGAKPSTTGSENDPSDSVVLGTATRGLTATHFTVVLTYCARWNKVQHFWTLWKALLQAKHLTLDSALFNSILHALRLKQKTNEENAQVKTTFVNAEIFSAVSNYIVQDTSVHYDAQTFALLLEFCCAFAKKEKDLFLKVRELMGKQNHKPGDEEMDFMVQTYAKWGHWRSANELLQQMRQERRKISVATHTTVLEAYSKAKPEPMISHMEKRLKALENQFTIPNSQSTMDMLSEPQPDDLMEEPNDEVEEENSGAGCRSVVDSVIYNLILLQYARRSVTNPSIIVDLLTRMANRASDEHSQLALRELRRIFILSVAKQKGIDQTTTELLDAASERDWDINETSRKGDVNVVKSRTFALLNRVVSATKLDPAFGDFNVFRFSVEFVNLLRKYELLPDRQLLQSFGHNLMDLAKAHGYSQQLGGLLTLVEEWMEELPPQSSAERTFMLKELFHVYQKLQQTKQCTRVWRLLNKGAEHTPHHTSDPPSHLRGRRA
eukprot:TRINITY_DN61749_c0_g1_i1.p1 TRINITY_DN61749_c0_g1~~TRINITY_DN61749_c0_g1_i1.p1  ORF type:complete len:790 (+),score=58.78 TRINITY_DN61749_c0_g1_i1:12-2381(+)